MEMEMEMEMIYSVSANPITLDHTYNGISWLENA